MEGPNLKEGLESKEDMEIVREELRGALLVGACAFDESGACEKKWFEEHNKEFEKLFDEFVGKNADFLSLWVSDRNSITSMFHDQLNDLDIQKDLAA